MTEVSKPQRKEGEVLVRITAAGVNFVDLLYVGLNLTYFAVIAIEPLFII